MTLFTDLLPLLALAAAWMQTPDASNALFALLSGAALIGLPDRVCICLTLLLHLALLVL